MVVWAREEQVEKKLVLGAGEDPFDHCLRLTLDHLARSGHSLSAIGHRVVHGGSKYKQATLINESVLEDLRALISLAPLHQPTSVKLIQICRDLRIELPQVACFDTMFHHTLPSYVRRFAIPQTFTDDGLVRYGFHGLSYESVTAQLCQRDPATAGQKLVIAHLGAGASLCGVASTQSVSTTMGFSALDGLPMGTRCGRIDPGLLIHWMRSGLSVDELEDLLYRQSGLLGLSGVSADMQVLQQSDEKGAKEAVEFFVFRVAHEIGGVAADLGGVDRLVFTGGIGENDADIRRRVVERCAWLGFGVDHSANRNGDYDINLMSSSLPIHVVPAKEEWVIAQKTAEVLKS